MFHESSHTFGKRRTPYAVSFLRMYINCHALCCPRNASYRTDADAALWFLLFLTWKSVFCSFFLNIMPMSIHNLQLFNLNAMYSFMFSIRVAQLTKIWEGFLHRQSKSLLCHLAVHLLKFPKWQPTLSSTTTAIKSDYCLKLLCPLCL